MRKKLLSYIFKFTLLMLFIFTTILFSACGKQVTQNTADEVRVNIWEYTGEQGVYSELKFEENLAVLTISNNDEYCEIKGLCVIDDSKLIIIDNSLKKEFLFNYEITGTTLTLNYNGDLIEFSKRTY